MGSLKDLYLKHTLQDDYLNLKTALLSQNPGDTASGMFSQLRDMFQCFCLPRRFIIGLASIPEASGKSPEVTKTSGNIQHLQVKAYESRPSLW